MINFGDVVNAQAAIESLSLCNVETMLHVHVVGFDEYSTECKSFTNVVKVSTPDLRINWSFPVLR